MDENKCDPLSTVTARPATDGDLFEAVHATVNFRGVSSGTINGVLVAHVRVLLSHVKQQRVLLERLQEDHSRQSAALAEAARQITQLGREIERWKERT